MSDRRRSHRVPLPDEGRRRVIIAQVLPEIDGGRFPIKRTPGETVRVEADMFADGHDKIAAVVRYRARDCKDEGIWHEVPMTLVVNDRWTAELTVEAVGWYEYTVEAWVDHFASWCHALEARIKAEQDIRSELLEGAALVKAAAARSPVGPERR